MTTQIQLRRDTTANWAAANPVLAEGEIGMDMTANAFKVGDGSSSWADIEYAGGGTDLDGYATESWVSVNYQPKGTYLVPNDLNPYATQTWVSQQGYATQTFVSENYQRKGSYLTNETDPTVPDHVKGITQDDIDGWNAGGGSGGSIADGDTEGQVTTWDGAAWTPDSSLTIDSTGDATFSGTATADTVQANSINSSVDGRAGLTFGGSNTILPSNKTTTTNAEADLGRAANRFKDAYFSGTVDAAGFTINGTPISGGGGGSLPDGDFTHNGTITATDFIATSDERVKDNITTAPVGLIDSLKGREWEWKESGEKGSGVVAQELEEVLPHLVHTDEEGMKSVSYMGLCAYLIEEVKALKAEVEALK